MPTWGAEWIAVWTDVRTGRTRETTVSPTLEGLDVRDVEGEWRTWRWEEVRQGAGSSKEVELLHGGESVRVADRTMIDSIHRIAPKTRGLLKSGSGRKLGAIAAIYGGAILCGALAVWFGIGWVGAWAAMMAPRSWEKRIGEASIGKFAPPELTCGNRELYLAVQAIAGRLAVGLPGGQAPFDIRMVDDPAINAVTLPGGYIVIYRGLLRSADTPEEMAGVLAHEMQHALERHSMKALGRQFALWTLVGWLTGGADAATAQMAGALAGLKMQRGDEEAADEGALRMLEAARISSDGFVSFFDKLARKEDGAPWLAGALSTHPETRERLERIRRWQAEHHYAVQPLMSEEHWRAARVSCR